MSHAITLGDVIWVGGGIVVVMVILSWLASALTDMWRH